LAFKDGEPYRSEAEFQAFKQKDGLMQLATFLRETEKLDDAWFNALEANVQQEIEIAFSKADAAPFPDASTVADYQYAVSMS
jgi:TPP-dependent pyruvate/acetoin dehydrogenase alpha subunit